MSADDPKEPDSMSEREFKLKMRGMWAFVIIIIFTMLIGLLSLYYMPSINGPIYQNATEFDQDACKLAVDHCTVKMGFISIIILVSTLIGFVGINYLSHPTEWSKKMIEKGRTLEYITVILIVGIVLILALLEMLKSETVGTLLGTLAGYVLGKSVDLGKTEELGKSERIRQTRRIR